MKHMKINLCCRKMDTKAFWVIFSYPLSPCSVPDEAKITVCRNKNCRYMYYPPPTCNPSMASLRIDGVSLEACLKEKLLQSIIRMKPFIWSSWSSMSTSKDSRIARRISMKEFLMPKQKKKLKSVVAVIFKPQDTQLCCGWDMNKGQGFILVEFF